MGRSIESTQPTEGRFVDGADRAELANMPLVLVAGRHEPKAKYGPRWVVDAVIVETGEKIKLAFADNGARGVIFADVVQDLAEHGADAFDPVVLELHPGDPNDYWAFRSATADEIEQAEADSENTGENTGEITQVTAVLGDDGRDSGRTVMVPVPRRRSR